jgi:hypothetical protein
LLFITLTARLEVDRPILSRAIAQLIRRVKRKILGRKAEQAPVACFAILEPSYRHGVHAHVLLEDPRSVGSAKAFPTAMPIAQLIAEEWGRLDVGGARWAQDIQPVYDLDGALTYLTKTIGGASMLDRLDINSLCLPNRSAHSPIPNSHVPVQSG